MQKRTEEFVDLTGKTWSVGLMEDEQIVASELNPLRPIRKLSTGRALQLLADLEWGGGTLAEKLGTTGPLVASRAGVENSDNPLAELFGAKFGRDSMIIAGFLDFYPKLERSTIVYWAEREGRINDPDTHEEPGGRIHEERPDPNDPQRKRLELGGMRFPDFGSVDAPGLWCVGFLRQANRDPDFADVEVTHYRDGDTYTLAQSFEKTLALLDRWRAANPEGLIETEAIAGSMKSFPFWKDSPDAYHHRNGDLARPPVSSVEMMAYLYDTYSGAASLAEKRPDLGWDAQNLQAKADEVQASLIKHYWVEDDRGGFFALGTDRDQAGNLRQLAIRSSNMGYLLDSGILEGDAMRPYREATVRHLMSAEMLCPAGIRTLATDELRNEPRGYHNGTVWPHDTYTVARGMRRHYPTLAVPLFQCAYRTCKNFLPEHVPGTEDPVPEPNSVILLVKSVNVYGEEIVRGKMESCQPVQGWAAAAFAAVKHVYKDLRTEAALALGQDTHDARFAAEILRAAEEGGLAPVINQEVREVGAL